MWSKIWQYIKSVTNCLWKWLIRYPIAIPITIILIIMAAIASLGGRHFYIGGILDKLWGRKVKDNKRDTITGDRIDKDGEPIKPGESDDVGFVQAPVKINIKDGGIFSNNEEIVIEDPDEGEIIISLPEGVKNHEIKEVIRITPKVYEVRNNDGGTSVHKLNSLIDELDK